MGGWSIVYTVTLVHCLLFGWDREMVNLPIYSECSAYLSL